MSWCGLFKVSISLFAVSTCTSGRHNNDTSCGEVTYCKCQNSNIYGTTVDCSGAGLNTTEVCLICSNISNVTTLDLSCNSLDQIPELCFQGCKELKTLSLKVSKVAKIRNRYNQVPHLTKDTNGKVTNSQKTPQTRAKRSALSQQVTTKHI